MAAAGSSAVGSLSGSRCLYTMGCSAPPGRVARRSPERRLAGLRRAQMTNRPAKWPAAYRLQAVNAYRKLPEKTEAAVNQLAAEFGVRGRTLYRWVARFHDAGADGLADHKRSDAGQPRILRFPLAAL